MKPGDAKDASKNELRQALGQFATGVTIVTSTGNDLEPIGVTANSFSSVSLEPPMVLWSLSNSAHSKELFRSAEYFCVHVLTAGQQILSERFACAGGDKFAGIEWSHGLGFMPLLTDYVARFQCRTVHRYPTGDHVIFVGEVLQYDKNDKRPLVFHGGRYAIAERRMMADIACQVGDRRKHRIDRRAPVKKRYAD